MNKKKILVIMMYWFPYEGPIPMIYKTLLDGLIKKGYEISLIASFPHYRFGRKEKWPEFKHRVFEKTNWNGITLYRTWVCAPEFRSTSGRFVFRMLNYISYTISSFTTALFVSKNKDIILVPSSPPLLGAFIAYLISRIRKIEYVYNIQDLYPENLRVLKIINNPLLLKILSGIENFFYKKAARITVISEKMKEIIGKKINTGKIVCIPNFHDTQKIVPLPKSNSFSIAHSLVDRFVVSYIGGVSFTHGLEFVIEAAERLRSNASIVFLIIGRGEHISKIQNLSEQKNLSNVLFLPEQPYETINEIWASSDVSIVCMRKGMSGYQVPSKTFGIMSCGRPVVAMLDEESAIWEIVKKSEGGVCVPPERSDLLSMELQRLFEMPEYAKQMGEKAREYVVSNYSEKMIIDLYNDVFESITVG